MTARCTQLVIELVDLGNARGLASQVALESVTVATVAGCTQMAIEVVEGSDHPLLHPDGVSALPFDFPGRHWTRRSTLATQEQQRHTRSVYDRVGGPRRCYSMSLANATGEELDRVRRALLASRWGAVPVFFRVPVDDPTASPAVRYRIMNAGQVAEFVSRRGGGGAIGTLTLEIEEV
jgi:hypothetical protein